MYCKNDAGRLSLRTINRPPKLKANFVGIDDKAAGVVATEHLLQIGCRRIAHIRGAEKNSPAMGGCWDIKNRRLFNIGRTP
jgi:DNA-binding LacI/PurR family transcriptional regulator